MSTDDLKRELWQGCMILYKAGLVRETGHLSVRISPDRFLMPPRKSPGFIKPEEILTFDGQGRLIEGKGEPNSETPMHLAVYHQRPDVISVAHTHSDMSVVLGVVGEPLRPVHKDGGMFGPLVNIFDEVGLIQTSEKAKRMADALRDKMALLLRGHGAVIAGDSIKKTVIGAIRLEYCARLQVMAMSIGKPYYFSAEECADSHRKFNLKRAWEYYIEVLGSEEKE